MVPDRKYGSLERYDRRGDFVRYRATSKAIVKFRIIAGVLLLLVLIWFFFTQLRPASKVASEGWIRYKNKKVYEKIFVVNRDGRISIDQHIQHISSLREGWFLLWHDQYDLSEVSMEMQIERNLGDDGVTGKVSKSEIKGYKLIKNERGNKYFVRVLAPHQFMLTVYYLPKDFFDDYRVPN